MVINHKPPTTTTGLLSGAQTDSVSSDMLIAFRYAVSFLAICSSVLSVIYDHIVIVSVIDIGCGGGKAAARNDL